MKTFLTKRIPIDNELKSLMEHVKDMPRGSLIKHEDIESVTSLERDTPAWRKLIVHWKKTMMRTRSIEPRPEPGIGYRLPTVEEQFGMAISMDKQAGRRINHAAALAGVIPTDQLTEDGRKLQSLFVGHADALQKTRKEQIAERKTLVAAYKPLPRLGMQ